MIEAVRYMTGEQAFRLHIKLYPFIAVDTLWDIPAPSDTTRWFRSSNGTYRVHWQPAGLTESKLDHFLTGKRITFGQFLDAYNIEITDLDDGCPERKVPMRDIAEQVESVTNALGKIGAIFSKANS